MKRHTSNTGDSGKRYRWFLTCFLASVALLFIAMSGRAWAATIVVNSTADNATGGNGLCTLRESINNANAVVDTTSGDCVVGTGADTITFTGAGVGLITLIGGILPTITDAAGLTINGGSLGLVTISGGGVDRVFNVNAGASLTLENLTVTGGNSGGLNGGGIFNAGTLTITNSALSGNSATAAGGGGGIFNNSLGSVEIINSTLSGNSAGRDGGGIFNAGGDVTITNSTLSDNSAARKGGGIGTDAGDVTITNSTLSGNSADFGGGIFNDLGSIVTITNSTLSGNSATSGGGGIFNGIGCTVTITNSIVANSPAGDDCANFGAFTANGHNLDTDGTCQNASPNFATVNTADLKLGTLFFNGGPTKTHALLAGSFAINNGVQSLCTAAGITEDQRGETRDGACDIGAYEFITPPPPPPADLSISKSAAKTAQSGKQLTYTINVTNNGPNPASAVVVNDVLPTGTGFVSVSAPGATSCTTPPTAPLSTGTVSCSYSSLPAAPAPGSSFTLVVKVKITAKGNTQLNNTATVTSATFDPNLANNSATATTKLGK